MRLLLLFLTVLLVACSPGGSGRIGDYRESGELRVATRLDAISYRLDAAGEPSGFEHDLLVALARELGVQLRFDVYPDALHALDAVLEGRAHLAAAALGRNERIPLRWSSQLRELDYLMVARADSADVSSVQDFSRRSVAVRRGSLLAEALEAIRRQQPDLRILPQSGDEQSMLEGVATGRLDMAATDRVHFALAAIRFPQLTVAYDLPAKSGIAWALPQTGESDLAERIEAFIQSARDEGLLARVADRYFGYVRRLDQNDVKSFLARIPVRLAPQRKHFQEAERATGIDWRFLAAMAYQESQWDPLATSPTGVRGMMMLTAETADRLGVEDRLDPRQSILGGARYFAMLREELPDDVPEPDRTWMTVAAYNLGMGHMNGARAIARSMNRDNTSWFEMKRVLPLMARPAIAARLKAGPARGGEAVIMAENVRSYYDILTRSEAALGRSLAEDGPRLGPLSSGRAPRGVQLAGSSRSSPPMYGRSAAGITTEPSASW